HATRPGCRVVAFTDSADGIYKKLVVSADRQRLLGGVLVGDASSYGQLLQLTQNQIPLRGRPEQLILPQSPGANPPALGIDALPEAATICSRSMAAVSAARSASRPSPRSWPPPGTSTCSTTIASDCRTPTTASWRTSSEMEATPWSRACRGARSPRTS